MAAGSKRVEESMREEMLMRRKIATLLAEGPLTIPQIAERLGAPVREVTLWVMGMWRYGLVEETGKSDDEGYFSYRLKDGG